MTPEKEHLERFRRLTQKQRACLDLVLERKTSKEIARILGISTHAVDLRLTNARMTLGASNRAQSAILYEQLRKTYGEMTCHLSLLPDGDDPMPLIVPDEAHRAIADHAGPNGLDSPRESYDALFKDLRRRDHSITRRTIYMVSLVGIMVVVIMLGLGIAETLSDLISV
jgi:DNA-binding CsgD family transcriptional regulator